MGKLRLGPAVQSSTHSPAFWAEDPNRHRDVHTMRAVGFVLGVISSRAALLQADAPLSLPPSAGLGLCLTTPVPLGHSGPHLAQPAPGASPSTQFPAWSHPHALTQPRQLPAPSALLGDSQGGPWAGEGGCPGSLKEFPCPRPRHCSSAMAGTATLQLFVKVPAGCTAGRLREGVLFGAPLSGVG